VQQLSARPSLLGIPGIEAGIFVLLAAALIAVTAIVALRRDA
jgi:hypothetical protein